MDEPNDDGPNHGYDEALQEEKEAKESKTVYCDNCGNQDKTDCLGECGHHIEGDDELGWSCWVCEAVMYPDEGATPYDDVYHQEASA